MRRSNEWFESNKENLHTLFSIQRPTNQQSMRKSKALHNFCRSKFIWLFALFIFKVALLRSYTSSNDRCQTKLSHWKTSLKSKSFNFNLINYLCTFFFKSWTLATRSIHLSSTLASQRERKTSCISLVDFKRQYVLWKFFNCLSLCPSSKVKNSMVNYKTIENLIQHQKLQSAEISLVLSKLQSVERWWKLRNYKPDG